MRTENPIYHARPIYYIVKVRAESARKPIFQSCPWVGSIHGLGWVGLDRVGSRFFNLRWVGLGRIASQINICYYCGGLHN